MFISAVRFDIDQQQIQAGKIVYIRPRSLLLDVSAIKQIEPAPVGSYQIGDECAIQEQALEQEGRIAFRVWFTADFGLKMPDIYFGPLYFILDSDIAKVMKWDSPAEDQDRSGEPAAR